MVSALAGNVKLFQIWYIPVLAAAMALMLVRLMIVAQLLTVSEFAAYSAGLLISSSFCMLGCLGLNSLLQRDLPIMIIRRRENAGGVLLMQCVIIAFILVLLPILFVTISDVTLVGLSSAGLSIALIHGLSQQLFTVVTVDSRSRQLPNVYAKQNLLRSILLLLVGPIVFEYGGGGVSILAFEASLTLLVSILILFRKFLSTSNTFLIIIFVAFRRLTAVKWATAFTLLAASTLSFFSYNLDRWIAAQWLSTNMFGQYAFSWTILIVSQSFHLIINASFYPILAKKVFEEGQISAKKLVFKISLLILSIGGVCAIFLIPSVEFLVRIFFSNFYRSIEIIPIIYFAAIFRMTDFWPSYLIVIGRERFLLYTYVFNIIVIFGLWWSTIGFDMSEVSMLQIAYLALALSAGPYISTAIFSWTLKMRTTGN